MTRGGVMIHGHWALTKAGKKKSRSTRGHTNTACASNTFQSRADFNATTNRERRSDWVFCSSIDMQPSSTPVRWKRTTLGRGLQLLLLLLLSRRTGVPPTGRLQRHRCYRQGGTAAAWLLSPPAALSFGGKY
jgi:hypothetical protein